MIHRSHALVVLVFVISSVTACKKGEKAPPASTDPTASAAPTPPAAAAPPGSPSAPQPDPDSTDSVHDELAKPSLTDDKIKRYLKASAEAGNPFLLAGRSLKDLEAAAPAQEAFIKKYGFASADEYTDIVNRITIGESQLMVTASVETLVATTRQIITENEKRLADPALPAEAKAQAQEMINDAKQQLAAMQGPDAAAPHGLNAADLALVKKYEVELAAASKANQEAHQKSR